MRYLRLKNKQEEIKTIKNNVKFLERIIKKEIKEKEKYGYVIQTCIKNSLFSLLCSIEDIHSYNLIKDNILMILNRIPDYNERQNRISPKIYRELLNLLSANITNQDINSTILKCILDIDEISEWERKQSSTNYKELIELIYKSKTDYKKIIGLELLKNIKNVHNEILEARIIIVLDKIETEEKLEQFRSLMNYLSNKNISNLGLYIEKFLDYIEMNKNKNYDNNLNEIIKKLYNSICEHKTNIISLEHLTEILSINSDSYNNRNMKVIIKLLDTNLYEIKPFNRILLFNKILDMNFKDKEFENKFIDVVSNIIIPIKDSDLQEKVLDRIFEIKTTKSLEVMKDLYPILCKYTNKLEINDTLSEITKVEKKQEKVKKLTIPIKYEMKED